MTESSPNDSFRAWPLGQDTAIAPHQVFYPSFAKGPSCYALHLTSLHSMSMGQWCGGKENPLSSWVLPKGWVVLPTQPPIPHSENLNSWGGGADMLRVLPGDKPRDMRTVSRPHSLILAGSSSALIQTWKSLDYHSRCAIIHKIPAQPMLSPPTLPRPQRVLSLPRPALVVLETLEINCRERAGVRKRVGAEVIQGSRLCLRSLC